MLSPTTNLRASYRPYSQPEYMMRRPQRESALVTSLFSEGFGDLTVVRLSGSSFPSATAFLSRCCPSADNNAVGYPIEPGLDCPDCSKRLSWIKIRFGQSFRCTECGASLCVPRSYNKWLAYYTLCLTALLAFWLGARGWMMLVAVLLGFFPVAMATATIARRVLPPKLTFSDDYLTHLKDID
jgi:hypothetical protein